MHACIIQMLPDFTNVYIDLTNAIQTDNMFMRYLLRSKSETWRLRSTYFWDPSHFVFLHIKLIKPQYNVASTRCLLKRQCFRRSWSQKHLFFLGETMCMTFLVERVTELLYLQRLAYKLQTSIDSAWKWKAILKFWKFFTISLKHKT